MYKTDSKRIPNSREYSDEELIGKYVRVASNASSRNYNRYGRIVGFTKNRDQIRRQKKTDQSGHERNE